MEATVGMGTEKGVAKEDGRGGGLDLGFGFESHHHHYHPQKLVRMETFPFRAVMNNNAATACSAGSVPPFSSSSASSSSPSYKSYDNGNGSCGGPTFFFNNDTICDLNDGSRGLPPFVAAFKSPGMAVAGNLRYSSPFTSAQWQELQRQALIYKHFMASAPVPTDLLFGSRDNFPNPATPLVSHLDRGAGYFNLRFSSGSDPEPGRCRRTDGKKWRCSRDVAPDQKYCERHMHRGRPRSRKPVELRKPSAIAAAAHDITTPASSAITASATVANITLSNLSPKPGLKLPLQSMATDKEPRYMDWMKADSEEMVASQQWQLMHSRMGLRIAAPVLQHYDSQPHFNCAGLNDPCCSFLNTDLSGLEDDSVANQSEQAPRRFIDAWSTENRNISSVSSGGRLPLSTLTLSMAGGGDDDTDQIEMGLGLSDSVKSQPLSWMTPASPLGGPLAEVLQSRNVASPTHAGYNSGGGSKSSSSCSGLNLMSKSCCGSDGASPRGSPTGFASSPTGVLQRTLVSHSDSSSSSSPTFGVASRSEVAVQWINLPK